MSVGSSVDIYYICNFVVYIERENDYTFNRIISLEQTSQNAISTDLFLGWRGGGGVWNTFLRWESFENSQLAFR